MSRLLDAISELTQRWAERAPAETDALIARWTGERQAFARVWARYDIASRTRVLGHKPLGFMMVRVGLYPLTDRQ